MDRVISIGIELYLYKTEKELHFVVEYLHLKYLFGREELVDGLSHFHRYS
jgi:hypothetical protein